MSIIINNNKNEISELIESSEDGNIRIWDFHNGNLFFAYGIMNIYLLDVEIII